MEIYLDNGLISEANWKNLIEDLEKDNIISINNEREALKILDKYILAAVEKRIKELDNFGILYSGALDSTVLAKICKDLGKDFTCYTIGFKDSKDIIYSEKAAKLLNLKLKIKILSVEDLQNALSDVVKIINNTNPVYVSIACVTYLALKFAKDNNDKIVINGLGAEEIFCGYKRNLKENEDEIHKESWRGLREMWKVDLERDYLISKNLGINVLTPFMDKDLIVNSMKIDPSLKINNGMKKIILRKYAEKLDIHREIAYRPKTAGQYGSKINDELKKLARRNNFNYVKEYLEYLIKN